MMFRVEHAIWSASSVHLIYEYISRMKRQRSWKDTAVLRSSASHGNALARNNCLATVGQYRHCSAFLRNDQQNRRAISPTTRTIAMQSRFDWGKLFETQRTFDVLPLIKKDTLDSFLSFDVINIPSRLHRYISDQESWILNNSDFDLVFFSEALRMKYLYKCTHLDSSANNSFINDWKGKIFHGSLEIRTNNIILPMM